MASLTVENYVKTIYQLCSGHDERAAGTGQIAAALAVSPGTVTAMLKTLSEGGLITYAPREGATLTSSGSALALRVLRRHRLIELFLQKTLNMGWDEVHGEAEHLEHAVSDLLVDRIDAYLGYPKSDPHGDPIPAANGVIEAPATQPLWAMNVGDQFQLARVLDQSSDFLRFLAEVGLSLGSRGRVISNHPTAGMVAVEVTGDLVHLSREAAGKILVAPQ